MYIIGKKFRGISKYDMDLFKNTYHNIFAFYKNLQLFGENLNVFDQKIRKEKNIVKFINNFQSNNFIHNMFDIDEKKEISRKFNDEINKFHKKIFKLNL